jgi:hypothetical protein
MFPTIWFVTIVRIASGQIAQYSFMKYDVIQPVLSFAYHVPIGL